MFDDNGGIGVQLFTIAGHVFADDGDGTFNGNPNPDNPLRVGDFPLAGVTVYEDRNGNSHHDDGEPNTVTDDFGLYQLRVSRVDRMSVIRPAGWVRSSPLSMGFGTVDIPMRQSSEIHGTLAEALNPTNPGMLAGVTVFADRNLNGLHDPGEESAITDDAGIFELPDLDNGQLRLTINEPGWSRYWTPSVLNLVPQLHLGYHLALYRSMSVQGVVYDDRDRDGQRDAGEAGVRDVLVHSVIAIGTFGDHPTLTTQTAPDGSFVIKDVPVNPAVDVDLQLSGTFIRSKMLSVHVDPANLTPLQVPVRVFGGITGSTVQLTKSGRQLLKGVHVYADRNNNRKHDENEPWTTSDQSGIYWLTPVTGEFTLRLLKKYRDLSLLSPLNLKSARPGQWIINDMVFLG